MSSEYIRYDCIADEELKEDSVFVNVSNRKAAPLVFFINHVISVIVTINQEVVLVKALLLLTDSFR